MSETRRRWRNCPGRPGYRVSSDGLAKSVPRTLSDGRAHGGGLLRPRADADGYLMVKVAGQWVHVHVLVLEAFHGLRPPGMEGCHGPGGSQDNRAEVLRWDTHPENLRDRERHKTRQPERLDWIGTHHPSPFGTSVTGGAAGG